MQEIGDNVLFSHYFTSFMTNLASYSLATLPRYNLKGAKGKLSQQNDKKKRFRLSRHPIFVDFTIVLVEGKCMETPFNRLEMRFISRFLPTLGTTGSPSIQFNPAIFMKHTVFSPRKMVTVYEAKICRHYVYVQQKHYYHALPVFRRIEHIWMGSNICRFFLPSGSKTPLGRMCLCNSSRMRRRVHCSFYIVILL